MSGADIAAFRLSPDLDTGALAARYREQGRVRIHGLLADAEPLARALRAREDWRQVLNAGDKVYELDRAARAGMGVERATALDRAVFEGAAEGFQFRFESIRVPDEEEARRASADPLAAFASWLSTGPARAFLREVTGASVDFADAQATNFGAGDFLTGHDDVVPGKNRTAAYVLGLTERWRPEWGGLLMFHDGEEALALTPAFNSLDLFAVPVPHSVSLVSPSAPVTRLSVTGWLRRR